MLDFSWSGVPRATPWPWSSMAIVSASWSASSRYCVVSRIVTPSSARSRTVAHTCSRLRGSRPVVGSSRKTSSGRLDHADREVEAALHAAGVGPHPPVAGSSRSKARSPAVRARPARRGRCSSRAIISRFSWPVSLSSTAAYWPVRLTERRTRPGRRAGHGRAPRRAGIRADQGGQDADHCGLAGAVRAESAKTEPVSMARSTWSSARWPRKDLVIPEAVTYGIHEPMCDRQLLSSGPR